MTAFHAVATGRTRVRVVFSQAMFRNAPLVDPGNYLVRDSEGGAVSVSSVSVEQVGDVFSTVLELGNALVPNRPYDLKVQAAVVTAADETPLVVDTASFQWLEVILRTQIPLAQFSGEVVDGLYGLHDGLVFFSPALETVAANSIIEVEQVDVCSRAYDEYHLPPQIEWEQPLMTHGAGVVPTSVVTTLNVNVLGPVAGGLNVHLQLGYRLANSTPIPVDGPVTVTTVAWPPSRVAFLNSPSWKLFDNLGTPPSYFITADNLTPIVPSPPVTVTL